jgi:tRNA A-37 threonylcarbamoyl transferase component Bud32
MLEHVWRKLRLLVAPPATESAEGYHWEATAAGREFLPHLADGLRRAAAPGVTTLKANFQREVRRAESPAGIAYIKITRVNSPRSFAREMLRPPKARLEYDNAAELQRRGVPTAEPLAVGTRRRGAPSTSVLVTREVAGAVPLSEAPPTRALTVGFARALAAMHEAGVDHPDPHPGNFLVNVTADPPTFTVMDVHAVRFSGPLSWRRTRAALVLLNRFYQAQGHAPDRLRFWRAYLAARPSLRVDHRAAALEVEAATQRSNLRFWTARLSRYTTDNRESRWINASVRPGHLVDGFAERDLHGPFVSQMLSDPEEVFDSYGTKLLKDSPSSTVAAFKLKGVPLIAKRFRVKSWKVLLKNAFRPTPAVRSWVLGRNLLDRGLPTARPLLMVERFRYGVPREGYVVFEHLPDALGLDDAVRANPDRRTLTAWAGEVGRLLRRMHDREVGHRDLKAANLLMVGVSDPATARPLLIDLVGVTVGRRVPDAQRQRDLGRLAVSFPAGTLPNAVRVAFLKAYLGPRAGGAWKVWWRALAVVAAAKVKRNRRRGRPLA